MPQMDGYEVTRRLRRRSAQTAAQMTIIAVSANAFEQQVSESQQAGCDAFLPKPIDVDRLLSLLQKHAGLTWTINDANNVADNRLSAERRCSETDQAPTLSLPDNTNALLDLAMKGELPRLMKVVEQFAAEDSAYRPFAEQLRPLVDNFDEEGVWALLTSS